MTPGEYLDGWVQWMQAAGRRDLTIYARRSQVRNMIAGGVDPLTCTEADILEYLAGKDWKPATRATVRAGAKSFFQWMKSAGHREDDPSRNLPSIRVPPPCPHPAPERALAEARMRAANKWERLAVDLAARAGLRRGEIAGLRFTNLVVDADGGDSLRITGKGGRTRVIPIAPDLADQIRASRSDYVFPSKSWGQHVNMNHMGELLSRLLGPGVSGHHLRHRFASKAYAGTRDLLAVQRLLGHSSPATTQVYVQVPMDTLRAVAYDAS
jgi:integrase